MKKGLILLMLLFLSVATFSQTNNWTQDYTKLNFNGSSDKLVMIYFSGSDWCKPCIKLKDDILSTQKFLSFGEDFILYQADFPYRVKQDKALKKFNANLAEKYNKDGVFPRLVITDSKGNVILKTGYKDISPEDYIAMLKNDLKKSKL